MESCSRIKDGNGRMVQGEDEVREIRKEYFDRYSGTVCSPNVGFDGIRRGNYFDREPFGRAEVEVGVGKLKNEKAAGKDEIKEKMIKGGDDRMVDWIWRLCNWPLRVVLYLKIGDLL